MSGPLYQPGHSPFEPRWEAEVTAEVLQFLRGHGGEAQGIEASLGKTSYVGEPMPTK